jgi:UDP-N-acetylmuramate dehydrogenase
LRRAKEEGIPVFVLGGGANILVPDEGIRGITLDTGGLLSGGGTGLAKGQVNDAGTAAISFPAGMPMDAAVTFAAAAGLSGMEDFAGLPGSVGGALWMNARCFDKSVSDILTSVVLLNENFEVENYVFKSSDFAYKKSPFQTRRILILEANFHLSHGEKAEIAAKCDARRREREAKGHFLYPSAGSVFKNDRRFGKPSGQIIDELGLRGTQSGGARIADFHGNFIVNTGGATARDVLALIRLIQGRVQAAYGITPEPEIILV